MNAPLFKLQAHDFFKGAVTAVFAAIVTALYAIVMDADFNVFTADWAVILSDMLQISLSAFVGYLGKNFLTSEDGKIAGI